MNETGQDNYFRVDASEPTIVDAGFTRINGVNPDRPDHVLKHAQISYLYAICPEHIAKPMGIDSESAVLVLENLPFDIRNYAIQHPEQKQELIRQLQKIVNILKQNHTAHGDLNYNNIRVLIDKEGNPVIKLIDPALLTTEISQDDLKWVQQRDEESLEELVEFLNGL